MEVTYVTKDEFEAALAEALDDLGLTYEQLQDQARTESFQSEDARRLWDAVGGVGK